MIDLDLAAELDGLAQAIARMRPPQNNNPEAFHEDRSELAARTRRLALRARGGAIPKAAADVPAPQVTFSCQPGQRLIRGGIVVVEMRGARPGVR